MPLFRLTALVFPAQQYELTIRARCESCARNLAATNSREEGPRTWRDPARSTARLLAAEESVYYPATGGPSILDRVTSWTKK